MVLEMYGLHSVDAYGISGICGGSMFNKYSSDF